MELKLKEEYVDTEVYVSFSNANIVGKFIPEGLYPHLYKTYPHLFDEVEVVKVGVSQIINEEQFFAEEAIIDMFEPKKKK